MAYFNKTRTALARYKSDEEGSFTTVWTIGLSLSIVAIGAGIDLASSSRVALTAQSVADQVALTSAVFYSTHERLPENRVEGYMHNAGYSAKSSGFSFPSNVEGGDLGVHIKALYDVDAGEVSVEVWGKTETALMSIFGRDTMKFRSKSTAKFKTSTLRNPASVALVLDNSGSMAWDDTASECEWVYRNRQWNLDCDTPSEAAPRIDGLKTSVNGFMSTLETVVGPQAVTGKRVLRTGMLPYSNAIIANKKVDMDWGFLSTSEVNAMTPSGSTNSSAPINEAKDWLDDEKDVHAAETGESNPLRYMIFMTDGQNSGTRNWVEKDGTGLWRGEYCYWSRRRYTCSYSFETGETEPSSTNGTTWEEGEYPTAYDTQSIDNCNAMKASGVRIFTIGFALEPGTYLTNYTSGSQTATIEPVTTHSAYSLLEDCASSPTDFVTAEDTSALDEAFTNIGESIVQDVVRLSE